MDATWTRVDEYLESVCLGKDPVLEAVLKSCDDAELPRIAVSPLQGRFLGLMVQLRGAARVLEVGTLGGYSTICMARRLAPGGKLVTLEIDDRHATVARENFRRAGLSGSIELHVGPASDTLDLLIRQCAAPFDVVFIDADKPSTRRYFECARRLTRPGSVIIVDNVVRHGAVADEAPGDDAVRGIREFFEVARRDPGVSFTALQTVGLKGYDGLAIAVVNG